jgi:hypothetical protein
VQLSRPERISTALTAFTAALLGAHAVSAADNGKVDSSLLIYSETNRVKLAEGVVDLSKPIDDKKSWALRAIFDVLTGASPNGATPSSHIQTFTGASGHAGYSAPAGAVPLDNTFHDRRFALDGNLIDQLNHLTVVNIGGHLSWEHDYSSYGVNGAVSRDFNRKNTTLGVSGSFNHDTVSPIGGAHTPFSSMPAPTPGEGEGEGEGDGGGGSGPGLGKNVADVVVSLSQVLGRKTLLQMNYSYDRATGYLTDPYKLLSLVGSDTSDAPGEPVDYLYEKRPDARAKQALYGELRRYIAGAAADVSYRYFWDDWGIHSQAVDLVTYLPLPHHHALEPHVRWYRQSQADFFHTYLVQGQALPQFATADARLAGFDAWTFGLKYSIPIGDADQVGISGEYYEQVGTRAPPNPIGILANYDLFPALNVFMLRVGFTHALD